jgi:crossover junction endodeoxyribonuclease RuvC
MAGSALHRAVSTTRIIGIDPGSRRTGYGVIDTDGQRSTHIANGCIKLHDTALPERLKNIYSGLSEVIRTLRPDEMAIELVFMHRNADSALKLGQARGAAIVAGVNADLPVFEFSATQVKQAVVGVGHATKEQVQHMIKVLLRLDGAVQADAADALAVALCYAHRRQSPLLTGRAAAGAWSRPR